MAGGGSPGSATELAKLTVGAAEYVYSKSQPTRWAVYLSEVERYDEAITFCRTAVASADPAERPGLLNTWATTILSTGGSMREALALHRADVKLKPDFWVAHFNIQNDLMILGDEEGAWRAGEDMRTAAGGRPGRAPETYYGNWDYLTWNLRALLDGWVADAEANAGLGTGTGAAGWRPRPAMRPEPRSRWKHSAGPMPIPPCPATVPAITAG